jgi:DNA-binding LacI/PurR family transcriptional regulator
LPKVRGSDDRHANEGASIDTDGHDRSATGGPRRSRPRLRDVARHAGVSIATASEALNNRGRVAPATRDRVRAAADALGYQPDRLARSLRTGRSYLLGVSLRLFADQPESYPTDPYFALLISAAAAAAMRRGYALVLLPDDPDGVLTSHLPVEAMLVADAADEDPFLDRAYAMGVPVVTANRPNDPRSMLTADIDVDAMAAMVFGHLSERGAKRPGLLGITDPPPFERAVEEAYVAWCESRGLTPFIERAPVLDMVAQEQAALRLWDHECDAVLGLADISGSALLASAEATGHRIPYDLMIACCSEDARYAQTSPPITTVSLVPIALADLGIEMAIDAIENGMPEQPRVELLKPILRMRHSTRS